MRFAVHHTAADKAGPFVSALVARGHEQVTVGADVFLVDLDIEGFTPLLDRQIEHGAKVVLIPHGPTANYIYDGIYSWDDRTLAQFVIGEGQREVMRRIGLPTPTYSIGWPWGAQLPFRPSAAPRKVLFAPDHPLLENGFIRESVRQQHRDILDQLLAMDVEITVRHVLDLEANGLTRVDGVEYVDYREVPAIEQVDAADVVVAVGTFARLAIARGVPTVMFSEHEAPYNLNAQGELVFVANWDAYSDYVRYPFDLSDGPLSSVIPAAAAGDDAIRAWRERFMGADFDPRAFATLVEELVRDPLVEDELRAEVHIAFADEVAASPDLLARYASRVRPDSDATLVLYAPGAEAEQVLEPLMAALSAAGIAEDAAPDMLIAAIPHHEPHERIMAARAAGLLSARAVSGPLAALPSSLPDVTRPAAPIPAA